MPILGLIENMAGLLPGPEGAEVAAAAGVPLLGRVPFDRGLALALDRGDPFVATEPASPASRALTEIAAALHAALERRPTC